MYVHKCDPHMYCAVDLFTITKLSTAQQHYVKLNFNPNVMITGGANAHGHIHVHKHSDRYKMTTVLCHPFLLVCHYSRDISTS
jgi:hypothetical protein